MTEAKKVKENFFWRQIFGFKRSVYKKNKSKCFFGDQNMQNYHCRKAYCLKISMLRCGSKWANFSRSKGFCSLVLTPLKMIMLICFKRSLNNNIALTRPRLQPKLKMFPFTLVSTPGTKAFCFQNCKQERCMCNCLKVHFSSA